MMNNKFFFIISLLDLISRKYNNNNNNNDISYTNIGINNSDHKNNLNLNHFINRLNRNGFYKQYQNELMKYVLISQAVHVFDKKDYFILHHSELSPDSSSTQL